jgi:hypothetical protein
MISCVSMRDVNATTVAAIFAGLVTAGSTALYLLGTVVLSAYGRQAGIVLNSTTSIEVVRAAIPLACFIGAYAVILGMNLWDYRVEVSREIATAGPERPLLETLLVHLTWIIHEGRESVADGVCLTPAETLGRGGGRGRRRGVSLHGTGRSRRAGLGKVLSGRAVPPGTETWAEFRAGSG